MDDSSLKPSIADRWSFAGWAGHDPRPDVQSLTVCIPMEGPAGAFPGAIDLSVQTRSGKKLLDRPVPAPAVLRSTESKPQPKSTEMSTTPPSSRETPTDRSFQQTPQDHRNPISSVHQRPDPDRAKPQPKLTETSASSPSPRKTPTGRSFQQTPQDHRNPISSVHQRPDPDRAKPQPKLTETSASSPSPRKTPTGRSFQQTPQDHRDPISSVHQRPDCAHVLTDRTNSNTASSPASAPAVLRSTEGKPQPESTETSTTPPSSRETPTVRSFQQTPQDHRNPISSVHQRPDPDRAKPQPKLTETSASPPSPRKTPTGRSFQQTPQDHREPISSVHQRPDPNRAKPQPKLTETSASSPSPRKTPTGRSFQQTPQDRREPISSVHQHPDPDRAKPQPKSTETSTSPSSPRETPASRSHQVTLPYLEVNDSPCDGGDQSMDESDAGSGEDYSSGSGEEWEPNSEDEDDPADKLNDTSFLNDCTIREYFEPFKNFMPDDEEPAKHKNGSQKYTRKGVRAARERGTGYVRRNGTVVPENQEWTHVENAINFFCRLSLAKENKKNKYWRNTLNIEKKKYYCTVEMAAPNGDAAMRGMVGIGGPSSLVPGPNSSTTIRQQVVHHQQLQPPPAPPQHHPPMPNHIQQLQNLTTAGGAHNSTVVLHNAIHQQQQHRIQQHLPPPRQQLFHHQHQQQQQHKISQFSGNINNLVFAASVENASASCEMNLARSGLSGGREGSNVVQHQQLNETSSKTSSATMSPRAATNVAPGWRRIKYNCEIIYISPSGAPLRNFNQVKEYLLSGGTCKCGLPCPFRPEAFFEFDSQEEFLNFRSLRFLVDGLAGVCLICVQNAAFPKGFLNGHDEEG
ncbi:conserved hypothetical protein [Culex quinquefasciatus]|uniref:MBD domain-containing protein n=1 Tax=Culex quinquefasciatus TaxID=7176 RepID=B0W7W0_CULQU|nr:conserved hypothetical protein [Culex quinquefasciatus]|eukprot:XP_001844794.1 conserved hypothetical protein [Culex quinquefasciatus]